jgi:hypothetical protein
MKALYQVRVEINDEIVSNRDFCAVCATKILAEKTIDGQPIIDFLNKIQKSPADLESFLYLTKELHFLIYILAKLEEIGPAYLVDHLNKYISLKYPQIKEEADKKPILNLRITFLGINSILSEILSKLLDFIFSYAYNMKLDKDVGRKVTTFLIERILGTLRNYTLMHLEKTNVWVMEFRKFNVESIEGLDLCDPLTITKANFFFQETP